MSAHQDPRRAARKARFFALFAWSFQGDRSDGSAPVALQVDSLQEVADISTIIPELERIDAVILSLAPKRPIHDFNKVDIAILRQALYEILCTNTPARVVIDEAIELAKQYGSEETAGFVNGVLGTYLDTQTKI